MLVETSGSNIDISFNMFKVKYLTLNNLFRKFNNLNISSVNLFINLESVIGPMYRESYEETLSTCTKNEFDDNNKCFISNVINLAAHYRAYFTKCRLPSNIIFYITDTFADPRLLVNRINNPKYRKYFFDKYVYDDKFMRINEIMNNGVSYAKTISDYIDRVFILTSSTVEASVIPYLVKDEKVLKSDINFFLTKDKYDLQYVNYNGIIIWPDKDESIILTKKNVMKFLRFKNDMDEANLRYEINPKLLSFMMAVLGNKKRNIEKIKGIGFKKLYKSLENLYLKDYIDDEIPSSLNYESLNELIKEKQGFLPIDIREKIGFNYMTIDIERQAKIVQGSEIALIKDQLVNKFDNGSIKKLNDKIFCDYPIQLQELRNYDKNSFMRNPFEDVQFE